MNSPQARSEELEREKRVLAGILGRPLGEDFEELNNATFKGLGKW